jgi:hypothetical protein
MLARQVLYYTSSPVFVGFFVVVVVVLAVNRV